MGFWDAQWDDVYNGQHSTDCKALVHGCDNYYRLLANHTHPRSIIQCNPVTLTGPEPDLVALESSRDHDKGIGAYRVDKVHNADSCRHPQPQGAECEVCDDGYNPNLDENRTLCKIGFCDQVDDPFLVSGKSCVLGDPASNEPEGLYTVQKDFKPEVRKRGFPGRQKSKCCNSL